MPHNEKILIVDDERRMCDSLKALLSAQGYEIKTYCNGHDALACLTRDTVDLVLLDIVMEQMNGFGVMERMTHQHPDIPVILITGHSSTASAVEALRKGAYDYLIKPFEPEELFTSVKNALDRRMLKKDFHSLYSMMRLLCDNVPDMIWAKDLEKRFVFVNKAICKDLLNAVDITEPIGKTDMFFAEREWTRHTNDPEWHTFGEICRDSDVITMDEGKAQRFDEFGNVQGNFLFLDVHKAPFLDENGKMIGTVGSARDVTAAKEIEKRLTESEMLLNATQRLSKAGGWQWNTQNQTMIWTEETYRIHDLVPDELRPGSPELIAISSDCYAPEDRPVILNAFNKCATQGEPYDLEFPFTSITGRRLYVRTTAHAVKEGDRVIKVVGNITDITERKRAEEEREKLESQNRQLQKAESLNRMAAAIAHHFNNQLAAVIGNLELTLEDLPGGNIPLENLTEAMKAARRAAEVSGLMLTYLGQTTSKQEPMDISEVCSRSLPLLRAVLPKRILLETHFAMPGPVINGNVNQIQQVLANLIANAREAVGDGLGAIELTVRTVLDGEIPVAHRFPVDWQLRDKVYACLEVADAGCGIAGKDIEKIFDPFFTSKFTGRGLGLPVVLGILKAHHGAIAIESKPGGGSIFRVFLPVLIEEVVRSPEKVAKAPEMGEGGTVLLVEDEEQVRKMARMMLTRLGFTVLEAGDGIDAVAVFRRHRDEIRWVLCDLTMPRMNGWETLAALRKLAPGIPVILSSGYNESQAMAGDHPERPDAFLHKPFSRKELAAVIRQVSAQE